MRINVRLDLDEATLVAIKRRLRRELEEATRSKRRRAAKDRPATRREVCELVEGLVANYAGNFHRPDPDRGRSAPGALPGAGTDCEALEGAPPWHLGAELEARLERYGRRLEEFRDHASALSYLRGREFGHPPGQAPR